MPSESPDLARLPHLDAHLERCLELAEQALDAGDSPFGSVLADASGAVLRTAVNQERSRSDATAHPELELARWAAAHVPADERASCVVYTSGEHCPMCAAGHAWVGLGPIVYAGSSAQLSQWRSEWGLPASPVAPLPITEVAPGVRVHGPVAPYDQRVRALHERGLGAG
ncbi:tRNA(Arg) A34 adenosine deaminase TadA [Nocardioides cavernae]|uniref:tRNA(Arg) A34 adenosine deaminase TadA n=1 Tax=Nocardioides cavernae TaxID=1921566 RepID=A0A7Y9KRM8_9ACTN|nr:nucleoside deaminase [Nocardioides cavernae]NYE36745.1 tRNA(Arg) A34 adenosine deaminase TadA [Nocardioides cavernae]